MMPAPPETAFVAAAAPEAPSPGSFEPIWDARPDTRPSEHSPSFDVEMTAAPTAAEPDPWVFDEPVRSADVPVARPEHPMHYPSTVRSRPAVPEAEPAPDVEPAPVVEVAAEIEPVDDPAPTNGHGQNGTDGSNGSNGSTPGSPLDLLRRSNESNGNGRNGRNGSKHENGAAPAQVVGPVSRPEPPPPPRSRESEPLAGFEHFPDAVAPPEVRWG